MRALGLQRTPVDHHTRRRLASLADAERRDDDVGDTAILFQRRWMADDRDGLALHLADAAEQVAAKWTVGGNLLGVTLLAVGKQPIVDAVIRPRRRRQRQRAVLGAERNVPAVALDQNVRPGALPAHHEPDGCDHQAERAPARLPQAEPQPAKHEEQKRRPEIEGRTETAPGQDATHLPVATRRSMPSPMI